MQTCAKGVAYRSPLGKGVGCTVDHTARHTSTTRANITHLKHPAGIMFLLHGCRCEYNAPGTGAVVVLCSSSRIRTFCLNKIADAAAAVSQAARLLAHSRMLPPSERPRPPAWKFIWMPSASRAHHLGASTSSSHRAKGTESLSSAAVILFCSLWPRQDAPHAHRTGEPSPPTSTDRRRHRYRSKEQNNRTASRAPISCTQHDSCRSPADERVCKNRGLQLLPWQTWVKVCIGQIPARIHMQDHPDRIDPDR